METSRIAAVLAAAGHPTRLEVLRLLSGEQSGVSAGEVGRRLGVVQNTMSAHLKRLAECGLVQAERAGTTLIYRLDRDSTSSVASFLASL